MFGVARNAAGPLRVVAVAEPDAARRDAAFATEHPIPPDTGFAIGRACLAARPPLGRVRSSRPATRCTSSRRSPAARGLHVLLEKPMAPTPAECVRVVEAAEASGRLLQIGHVLRYTPFYEKVHADRAQRADRRTRASRSEGARRAVAHDPLVRAREVPQSRVAAPILLAKSCHDLDLLAWLVDRPARRVASFGALTHYRPERAPAGAPPRCTDGCPVQAECPHDAVAFYAGRTRPSRALAVVRRVAGPESRGAAARARDGSLRALRLPLRQRRTRSPGRRDRVRRRRHGQLRPAGARRERERTIRVTGTRGELRGVLDGGEIEVSRAGALGVERFELEGSVFGHFGGDPGLMAHFSELLQSGSRAVRASGRAALESHLVGFRGGAGARNGPGGRHAAVPRRCLRGGGADAAMSDARTRSANASRWLVVGALAGALIAAVTLVRSGARRTARSPFRRTPWRW